MKHIPVFLAISIFISPAFAQNVIKFWEFEVADKALQEKRSYLRSFESVQVDTVQLLNLLRTAPLERTAAEPVIISLPMPDGTTDLFEIVESPIMESEIAQKYTNFRTFSGRSLKDRTATMRLSWTSKGLHAYILSGSGTVYINALREDKSRCISFHKNDFIASGLECEGDMAFTKPPVSPETLSAAFPQTGETLRTLRTAIAANGEYTAFHGGAVQDAMSAIVIVLNRLNTLFERELALRLLLVDNNDQIIFTNKDTDPYTNSSTIEMLDENMMTLDSIIGFNNYDVGHVFGRTSGGVASFAGNVCTSEKAGGVTGLDEPEGYEFTIEFTAHEFGHQLGANHTWSNCRESVENQRRSDSAMEPGSGSTIMSYSGLCPGNNIVETSHDNYHAISLIEINNILADRINGCYEEIRTENTPPTITAFPPDSLYIPINTSFELWAAAEDAEGDRLTYAWDQFDLGPVSPLGEPSGNAPSFRATLPNDDPVRTMPNFFRLILNQASTTEVLPAYNRDLTFNLVVRDNHPGTGGVTMRQLAFKATEEADSFRVLFPNERDDNWAQGQEVEIRWEVGGTDTSLVDCQFVDILLSYRANVNFTDTLAFRTPNDGVEVVQVPVGQTTNFARLKIKASDNIFFDFSDNYFRIQEAVTSTTTVYEKEALKISPNPVQEELQIFWTTPLAKAGMLAVWNVQGQLLKQQQLATGDKAARMNVSFLPKGIYFAEWQTEEMVQVVKFVIE